MKLPVHTTPTRTFSEDLFVEGEGFSRWVGALSLGGRSLGSLKKLAEYELSIGSLLVLSYPHKLNSQPEVQRKWERNRSELGELVKRLGSPTFGFGELAQYVATPMQRVLQEANEYAQLGNRRFILDVTGLTKFHTIISAVELANPAYSGNGCVAYTIPENYTGFSERERNRGGFSYTLIAPLVDGAKLLRESQARGVILPGHEGQRLTVAISEMEAVNGSILHSITPDRPDFEQVTRFRNRATYTELRLNGKWDDFRVDFRDIRKVSLLVRREIKLARANSAPLIIYPFGPKSVIFASVYTAAKLYPEGSWFVYPIPSVKSTQHTEGTSLTFWANL